MSLTVFSYYWLTLIVYLSTIELLHVSYCLSWLLTVSHCVSVPMELLHVSHCLLLMLAVTHYFTSPMELLYVSHCL